jgi:hypothetical protein
LGVAVLSLAGAIAILTAGIAAVFADGDAQDLEPPKTLVSPSQRSPVVPLTTSELPASADDDNDRKAA